MPPLLPLASLHARSADSFSPPPSIWQRWLAPDLLHAECHIQIIIQFDLFIDTLEFWCLIYARKRRPQEENAAGVKPEGRFRHYLNLGRV
ncbi:hypothetical protein CO676_01690 [Sinorhizobium sp. BJ1]|nr:hypothetical protein CO676_01690 [Sinorhizobium sp. BJ1]